MKKVLLICLVLLILSLAFTSCEILDMFTGENEIPIDHAHEFGEWVFVTEPTEHKEGLKERVCSCGEKETETVRKESSSLSYRFNDTDNTYTLIGIGACTDTEIIIPKNHYGRPVIAISDQAFAECRDITSIVIPDGVTTIGANAFICCENLTSVTIPDSVTIIGAGTFWNCTSLISITIPDSVTSIGAEAFAGCESLTSVTIGNNVTSIGEGAFIRCTSLTSVTIGNNITSIGEGAFVMCESLTSITIPAGVTYIGIIPFAVCPSLTEITVDANNQYYKSVDGNLYTKDGKTLIQYAAGKTASEFTIPDGVTSIGYGAFAYCESLTSVTLPDSITSIGESAFEECRSLTSITIPDSVTTIGGYAFFGCESLTIFCEAESQPEGWYSRWNESNCPVEWGYKG